VRHEGAADVDYGYTFTFRSDDGREAEVNVEAASGMMMFEADARGALRRYLDDHELPRRLVYGTDGAFHRAE